MEEIAKLKAKTTMAFCNAAGFAGLAVGAAGISIYTLASSDKWPSAIATGMVAGSWAYCAVTKAFESRRANSEANACIAAQASAVRTVSVQQPR